MKKSKKKSYGFIVNMEMFPYDVMFSIGQSDEEFESLLKKYLYKGDVESLRHVDDVIFRMPKKDGVGRCVHDVATHWTFVRVNGLISPRSYGTLVHEIVHAVNFILWHHIGIKWDDNSEEIFTYAIGYITEKVYKNLEI